MSSSWCASPLIALAFTLALVGQAASTADEKDYVKYRAAGPGVYAVKTSADGRVVSLLVIGQTRLPRVLQEAAGMDLVTRVAQAKAGVEFARFLEEQKKATRGKAGDSVERTGEVDIKALQNLERVHTHVDRAEQQVTVILRFRAP